MQRFVFTARRSCGVGAACLVLAAAAAVGGRAADAATPPACAASGLVVWLDTAGDGAAGSVYFKLQLTNLSGRRCSLFGYPGVSAVDLAGHQLGSAASRDPRAGRRISLANGATATATLRIVQVANYPAADCHQVTAAGLRVYPPGETASRVVPFPFGACSRSGPNFLSVAAVTS